MEKITKKRIKAYFIDLAISAAATAGVEYFLRKKVKSETVHSVIVPTVIMCSLEYMQLKRSGQTIGYKQMGLVLEDRNKADLSGKQILKRMAYRDMLSTFKYLGSPQKFECEQGAVLPQDVVAGTVVREV